MWRSFSIISPFMQQHRHVLISYSLITALQNPSIWVQMLEALLLQVCLQKTSQLRYRTLLWMILQYIVPNCPHCLGDVGVAYIHVLAYQSPQFEFSMILLNIKVFKNFGYSIIIEIKNTYINPEIKNISCHCLKMLCIRRLQVR